MIKNTMIEREVNISWAIHAMKEIIGLEELRANVIQKYCPDITNKKYIKTFDSFQQYQVKPYNNKENEILDYCKKIIKLNNQVVFTATNIQENDEDNETHYQTYILDNINKILYVINPSQDENSEDGYGIYKPEVTYKTIQPFFEKNKYVVEFIQLSNPAQINENDVYCQTWSLYILLQLLMNNPKKIKKIVKLPKNETKKYEIILNFYKELLTDTNISSALDEMFLQKIEEDKLFLKNSGINFNKIKKVNPTALILSMTTKELMEI